MAGPLTARLAAALDALTKLPPGAGCGVPDVTARDVWDAVPEPVRTDVLDRASAELARPAPPLLASDWARTFRDGERGVYEGRVRALRERVTLLVLAAVLTGEVAAADEPAGCPHLDAAADGLAALAEASTWCWAPHDRHTAGRGELLPDPDDPFLDLGAAEVAALFAWADRALGPHLDVRLPGLRRRLRREVEMRVLTPYERVRDWHWIGADGTANNWNPWIAGSVVPAALLLCEDGERRARLVAWAVRDLDHYLAVLPDDGGIDEGIAYWFAGAGRLLELLDQLADAGGPALDARDLPVLAELLRYPQRMHLGGDHYVNVGDAPGRLGGGRPWQVVFRWGALLGQPGTAAHAVAAAREAGGIADAGGLGRSLAALADGAWCRAVSGPSPLPVETPWLARESWLPRLQILVARESAGSTAGLTLAVKAGHNGEHHNHLDVGSYWVAVDGRPLVVDAGRPAYTAQTFGPDRYTAWPFRSAWHNVPEPGGEQEPGAVHGAREVDVTLDSQVSALRAELSCAYPAGLVARWEREVRLERAAGDGAAAAVVVEDRWEKRRGGPVLLRHVLAGRVEAGPGWATVAVPGGAGLRAEWDPRAAEAVVEVRALDDALLRQSWGGRLTRLTLAVAEPADSGRIALRWSRAH
ncbi:heparinase II/III domain-containing protein [Streptomyces sp. NRRL F-5123]|uniref:heparinase II/III domain-containing protein n=1 Tax=Streptomyces sp. NRRL F-5123 TaxID=1463856 RepID=UPI000AD60EB5|nr:heparinase II/III family protein [Streptomyces sp. NRRL F-5123]